MDIQELIRQSTKAWQDTAEANRKTLAEQEAWIRRVEAQVNTARSHGPGGDGFLPAIPSEFRHYVERAERAGKKDPVRDTAFGLWWKMQYEAAMNTRMRMDRSTEECFKIADDLERSWGYNPIQKGSLGEAAGGGGNIIPTPVEATYMRLITDNGLLRPLVRKISVASNQTKIPVEANAVSCSIVAEAGTIGDSMATTAFGQAQINVRKYAGLAVASNELFNDAIFDLPDLLFTTIAEKIARLEDGEALEGDGTNTTGLAITSGVASITVTTVGSPATYSDLVKLAFACQEAATRRGAYFLAHPKVWQNVVALTDSQGMPVFAYSSVPNAQPDRLLGYAVGISSVISTNVTVGSTGNTSRIYFGDPSRIIFADVAGVEFAIDPFSLMDSYRTRVRVVKRTGIVTPVGTYFGFLKGCRVG